MAKRPGDALVLQTATFHCRIFKFLSAESGIIYSEQREREREREKQGESERERSCSCCKWNSINICFKAVFFSRVVHQAKRFEGVMNPRWILSREFSIRSMETCSFLHLSAWVGHILDSRNSTINLFGESELGCFISLIFRLLLTSPRNPGFQVWLKQQSSVTNVERI